MGASIRETLKHSLICCTEEIWLTTEFQELVTPNPGLGIIWTGSYSQSYCFINSLLSMYYRLDLRLGFGDTKTNKEWTQFSKGIPGRERQTVFR